MELLGCTVSGNRAEEGAFLVVDINLKKASSHAVIRNCILSNGPNDIWSNGSPVEVGYTCISGGATVKNDPNGWLTWGIGNIVADPCFAKLGYWDPNGTPDDANDDFFIEGDYHLKYKPGDGTRTVRAGSLIP